MFIIVPVGHDETEIRRVPWVTVSLVVACVAVFTTIWPRSLERERGIEESVRDVAAYFLDHPYLELQPRVSSLLLGRYLGKDERERLEEARTGSKPPARKSQLLEEQETLTALEGTLLAELDGYPMRRYGLIPAATSLETWVSHMFMHGSWGHLFGNMLLLLLAGYCVEERWGRSGFLLLYGVGGLAAAGLFCFRNPDSSIPMVGASGAISAAIGAFLVRFWATRIHFFYWILLIFRGTFRLPAWLVTFAWVGNELLSAHLIDAAGPESSGGGIAHWAHLGGFGFGAAFGLVVRAFQLEARWIAPAIDAKVSGYQNTLLIRALKLSDKGSPARALELLLSELPRDPGNRDAVLHLWDLALKLQRAPEAAPHLARLIRDAVKSEDADGCEAAVELLTELLSHAPKARPDPLTLVRLGLVLAAKGRSDDAGYVIEQALDALPPRAPLPLALRAVKALTPTHRRLAERVATCSLAAPELADATRDELRRCLETLKPAAQPGEDPPLDIVRRPDTRRGR